MHAECQSRSTRPASTEWTQRDQSPFRDMCRWMQTAWADRSLCDVPNLRLSWTAPANRQQFGANAKIPVADAQSETDRRHLAPFGPESTPKIRGDRSESFLPLERLSARNRAGLAGATPILGDRSVMPSADVCILMHT